MLPRRLTALSWRRSIPLWAQSAYHITIAAWASIRRSKVLTSASWDGAQVVTSLSARAGVVTPIWIGRLEVAAKVGAVGATGTGVGHSDVPGRMIAARAAAVTTAVPPSLPAERRNTVRRRPRGWSKACRTMMLRAAVRYRATLISVSV